MLPLIPKKKKNKQTNATSRTTCNVRCNTSSHGPLSLQSYGAELDVNKKEPSPFQFNAASLLITQSKAKMSRIQF